MSQVVEVEYQVLYIVAFIILSTMALMVSVLRKDSTRDEKLARLEGYLDGMRMNTQVMPYLEGAYDKTQFASRFPVTVAKNLTEIISKADIPGVDGIADSVYNLIVEVTDGVPVVKKVEAINKAIEESKDK